MALRRRRKNRHCSPEMRKNLMTSMPNQPGKAWRNAALLGRLIVGGLFIYAAAGKIGDPMKFAEEVRAYQLAPVIVTNLIAILLPWLELIAGALLIVGFWRAEARLLILLMLIGFTFGKISVELRGLNINCGCWGSAWMEELFHGIWGILLNLALILLIVLDLRGGRKTTPTPVPA